MRVLEGQSLFDIAIQSCGSAEAAFDLAVLNGVSLTDEVSTGVELVVPGVINKNIASYYANKMLFPATGFAEFGGVLPETQQGIGFWAIDIDFVVS